MNHRILTQEEKHRKILTSFTFNPSREFKGRSFTKKVISRSRSIHIDDGVHLPQLTNEYISGTGILIFPEFVEYCFTLEGCTKKLLLYLIFHHVDPVSCEFLYNAQVVHEFK